MKRNRLRGRCEANLHPTGGDRGRYQIDDRSLQTTVAERTRVIIRGRVAMVEQTTQEYEDQNSENREIFL